VLLLNIDFKYIDIDNIQTNIDAKEAKVCFESYLSKLKKSVANDLSKQVISYFSNLIVKVA